MLTLLTSEQKQRLRATIQQIERETGCLLELKVNAYGDNRYVTINSEKRRPALVRVFNMRDGFEGITGEYASLSAVEEHIRGILENNPTMDDATQNILVNLTVNASGVWYCPRRHGAYGNEKYGSVTVEPYIG